MWFGFFLEKTFSRIQSNLVKIIHELWYYKFVIFLYLFNVLNTFSTVIDIMPFGSRKEAKFPIY